MLQKKICMLGSFSVGKTSLVRRYVESIFSDAYQTSIGVKIDKKVVRAGDEDGTLVLWDIHGEDVYQKIRMSYLRGMSGYLLVVDGTRRQTLDDAMALNERVIQEAGKVPAVDVYKRQSTRWTFRCRRSFSNPWWKTPWSTELRILLRADGFA